MKDGLKVISSFRFKKHTWLHLQCFCGKLFSCRKSSIISKNTNSCGCYRKKVSGLKNKTHGMSKTSEYFTWKTMKARCYLKTTESFARYGAKGITVCDRWLNSFENFYADMGPKPSKLHELDRIDPKGNYSAKNCRWTTKDVQARNKSRSKYVTHNGITKHVLDWALELNLNKHSIYRRLAKGCTNSNLILSNKRLPHKSLARSW